MNNKIQNIVLKSTVGIVVFFGALFTIWVWSTGDPTNMSDQEFEQLAIKEAKAQGIEKNKTQSEINQWVYDRGLKIKEEKTEAGYDAVSLLIDFTGIVFVIALILVIGSIGFLFTVDAKKAAISMGAVIGFALFLVAIYYGSGNEVPAEYVAKETLDGVADADRVFTPETWQFATAALSASGILTFIAALGWGVGAIMKIFK